MISVQSDLDAPFSILLLVGKCPGFSSSQSRRHPSIPFDLINEPQFH